MAAKRQPRLLTRGAVGEGNVEVGNVIEEMDLVLVQEETGSDGMDRCITPPLVEEAAVLIKRLKEVEVRLAAEPLQATNLEVGPLYRVLASCILIKGVKGSHTKWQRL